MLSGEVEMICVSLSSSDWSGSGVTSCQTAASLLKVNRIKNRLNWSSTADSLLHGNLIFPFVVYTPYKC